MIALVLTILQPFGPKIGSNRAVIRIALANTQFKSVVNAAAAAAGLKCAFRIFSGADLMELKEPVLLVFDAGGGTKLTPEHLQYSRRTHRGAVRYSPAVVFCREKAELGPWRTAGAVPLLPDASTDDVIAAFKAALAGTSEWVASEIYVGPERRSRKALLQIKKRRTADVDAAKTKAVARGYVVEEAEVQVSSLKQLHRRLKINSQMLQGASIESLRAFKTLVNEVTASVRAHDRMELMGLVEVMQQETEELLRNPKADTAALEDAILQLGDHVN